MYHKIAYEILKKATPIILKTLIKLKVKSPYLHWVFYIFNGFLMYQNVTALKSINSKIDIMYSSQVEVHHKIEAGLKNLAQKCRIGDVVFCYSTTLFVKPNSLQVYSTQANLKISYPKEYSGWHIVSLAGISEADADEFELSNTDYKYLMSKQTDIPILIPIKEVGNRISFIKVVEKMKDKSVKGWIAVFNHNNTGELIWITAVTMKDNFDKICQTECRAELERSLYDLNNAIMEYKKTTFY